MTVDLRPLPGRLARFLLAAIAVLIVLHLLTVYLEHWTDMDSIEGAGIFRNLFTLNDELAIPAWFASLLIFVSGVAVAFVGLLRGHDQPRERRRWLALAAVFVFLSADEMASIHEYLTAPLQRGLDLPGFLYFAWVIPYGVAALGVGVLALRLLGTLPPATRWRIVFAGALFVGGAIGMELVGGSIVAGGGELSLWYRVANMLEELAELVGMGLFLHTMVSYLVSLVPVVELGAAAVPPMQAASRRR